MSSLAKISELNSEQDFLKIITRSSPRKPLDTASLSAIWATLSLLSPPSSSSRTSQLGFLPSHLTLVAYPPSGEEITDTIAPPEAQKFLDDLTRTAHVTCTSLACSSVLAGLSSESDQYGDVGLCIGRFVLGEDKETQVVNLLGLEYWLQNGGRIVRSGPPSDSLPSGLAQIPQAQRATAQGPLDALTSLISRLEQVFEFRIEGGMGQGGHVIWIFLGKLTLDKEPVWVGLAGAGTWGEEDE